MKRILFMPMYTEKFGSSRIFMYNMLEYFHMAGYQVDVSPLFDQRYGHLGILSRPTSLVDMAGHPFYYAERLVRRLASIMGAFRYQAVMVERELVPYFPFVLESLVKLWQPNVVMFYDERIATYYTNSSNRLVRWLCGRKVDRTIGMCRGVIVANGNLYEYVKVLNPNVTLVNGGLDMKVYTYRQPMPHTPVVIGWMGTPGALQYMKTIQTALQRVSEKQDVILRVVCSEPYETTAIRVENRPWRLEDEAQDLQSFDIGIMPLTDDEWTRNKSAGKAYHYMAVGRPVVASPVGKTASVVRHGETGFLASTEDEWVDALTRLIKDPELRVQMGKAGRKIAQQEHNEAHTAATMLSVFDQITANG